MKRISLCVALVTLGAASLVYAQQQPPAMTQQTQNIKRTPLQKFDVPDTNFETVIGIAEIVPNVTIGRHTHPGPESGFMLEGEMVLMVQGQPDRTVKTGESYQVPVLPTLNPAHKARRSSLPTWSRRASRSPPLRSKRGDNPRLAGGQARG